MKFSFLGKNKIKKKAAARSRTDFSKNIRNAIIFFSKKKNNGRESQGSSGCSPSVNNSDFKCPSDTIFDENNGLRFDRESICGEEIQRKWSLQELFAVEDSWGSAFPAILWNAELQCKLSPSLQPVSPASSRPQRENERAGYINAGPESSGSFFNEGPSELDVAENPTSARGHESEARISSSQHSESPVTVSCQLQAERGGGTEGIGLSLEDIILLYEDGEMDEEDLVAFVKATCLRNRHDLCKLIDSALISPVQD